MVKRDNSTSNMQTSSRIDMFYHSLTAREWFIWTTWNGCCESSLFSLSRSACFWFQFSDFNFL